MALGDGAHGGDGRRAAAGGHAGGHESLVRHWARFYDVLAWVLTLGRERRLRDHLVGLARLDAGESVLDVGCGTGSLAFAARRAVGDHGQVEGIDPSPEMVARARRKAARAAMPTGNVRFQTGTVEALPFADGTFDVVMATLMLHHLTGAERRQGLAEIARVLAPAGRFFAADIGGGSGHHRFRRAARRYAGFDVEALVPEIHAAGLHVGEQGPVAVRLLGLPRLRFVLAEKAARSPTA